MAALERAREVLAFSTSQGSFEAARIPSSPGALLQLWCDALRTPDLASEDKEVVVRALRCSRFGEHYDPVLAATTPLLLDPLPSLRLQAAGCILYCLSASPAVVSQTHLASLVTYVSRALAPLPYQLPSASSTLHRFASTSLRILNTLVLKVHPLSSDTVAAIATILHIWAYYDSTPAGSASPAAPDRSRAPGHAQLSLGVMSAFMPVSTTSTRRRKGSTASASSRASSSSRADSGDEGNMGDRRRDSAQVRRDALACLRSLALADPRSLHRHWHFFLADSPYLRTRSTLVSLVEHDPSRSVRLQACAALDALLEDSAPYLALAEDRTASSSFTSLSAKLGEIVSELHLSLSSLLAAPLSVDRRELHLALLALAAQLARNSPYGRLKRPLARQLSRVVLPLLASSEAEVVVAGATTLTVLVSRYVATASSQPYDIEEVMTCASTCVEAERPEEVRAAGWNLLAASVPALPARSWAEELAHLAHNDSARKAVAEAQTAFLVALSCVPLSVTASAPRPAFASHLAAFIASPHPSVRALACTALPSPALSAICSPDFDPWRAALVLAAQDSSPLVQRAACRALGLLAKAEHTLRALAEGSDGEDLREAVRLLMRRLREATRAQSGELDVGGTAWALANCCDALKDSNITVLDAAELSSASVASLAGESSDEQTRTSALRILSFVAGYASPALECPLYEDCATAIQDGLSHPAAKVGSFLFEHMHLH
ncbi:hypothetical protein JCM3770_002755 [Rhodotorula araucariae]